MFRTVTFCFGLVGAQEVFLAKQDELPTSHNLTFSLHRETTEQHPLGYTVHKSTYLSPKVSLAPGEMVFTRIHDTIITMPEGKYAILDYRGEVVDKDEVSVPLDVVYDHHWIVRTLKVNPHVNELCHGPMSYNFGIGAESRNRPSTIPAGFGFMVDEGEVWGANLHLLHTVDLSGPAKECNECWYGPNKGPKCTVANNGTFDCCGELCTAGECKCAVKPFSSRKKTDYYLKYEVQWTTDFDKITPVKFGVVSAPDCQPEYNVLRNNKEPEQVASMAWKSPVDGNIVMAQGHLHTGAINISMYKDGKFLCASKAVYGTQKGVAGNELGHLVDVTPCFSADQGANGVLPVKKGDEIRIDGWYYVGDDDSRLLPGEGGTHLGVMSYMNLFYTGGSSGPDVARCQKQLVADGCELSSGSTCIQCAQKHTLDLEGATCTEAIVQSLCEPSM